MTQKQNKRVNNKNKASAKANCTRTINEYSHKPVFFSSEDTDRMAIESSRARLMLHLVSKPGYSSREFGSYFHAPRRNPDAVFIATSHTEDVPILKRKIEKYPAIQDVKNYSRGTSSEEYLLTKEKKECVNTCRCYRCEKRNEEMQNMKRVFKDNITRFSNNSTMTSKLHDACCGVCISIPSTPKTSDATISTSDVAVRDPPRCKASKSNLHSFAPILKKPESDTNFGQTFDADNTRRVTVHEDNIPLCDRELTDYEALLESFENKKCGNALCYDNSDDSYHQQQCRRFTCDEGISLENVTDHQQFTKSAMRRIPLRQPVTFDNQISGKSKGKNDSYLHIPYAHNMRSKYHSNCKKTNNIPCQWEIKDDIDNLVSKQAIPRKLCYDRSLRYCEGLPLIRLPKKVLTSERDIEAFIDNRRYKRSGRIRS